MLQKWDVAEEFANGSEKAWISKDPQRSGTDGMKNEFLEGERGVGHI